MRRRVEQRLVLVLPLQLHKAGRQILQRPGCGEGSVHEGAASALAADLTPDEELIASALEDRFDRGAVLTRPDEIAGRPSAEQQADRLDEYGLPRPGFAGQDVQTGIELHLDRIDDCEPFDTQEAEHLKEENSNANIGLTGIFTSCYSFAHPAVATRPARCPSGAAAMFRRAVCARLDARSSPCNCRRRAVLCPEARTRVF